MTVEEVRAATARLQRRGIEVGLFIMLGYDGEEEGDLEATVAHLKATRADTFLTTVAYPDQGHPLLTRRRAIGFGPRRSGKSAPIGTCAWKASARACTIGWSGTG